MTVELMKILLYYLATLISYYATVAETGEVMFYFIRYISILISIFIAKIGEIIGLLVDCPL